MRHASPQQIDRFLGQMSREEAATLLFDWPLWARPKQLPPAGNWRVWLLLAGSPNGWFRQDASGVLAIAPADERPVWQRSLRRLEWPNGVVARCYSAADPEQLRGPEFAACVMGARAGKAYGGGNL